MCGDFVRQDNWDIPGNDILFSPLQQSDYASCCTKCQTTSECVAFTYSPSNQRCSLKKSTGSGGNVADNSITGYRRLSVSLVINGNAETGPCQTGSGVTHPTFWNYIGSVSQTHYNDSHATMSFKDPGPSDRGQCYFNGQLSSTTSMWQMINLTAAVSSTLIDKQIVWFNISAWMGGWKEQDDTAVLQLTFLNQANQQVGTSTTIGHVVAIDRGYKTSLLFRWANATVPIGSRSAIVLVTFTRNAENWNDGSIDNIALFLYF
ncbi:unnamed protein product [Rotaria sp. Silwood2]|nr:unnamed protein product [Rotaria sp. Silwood2]